MLLLSLIRARLSRSARPAGLCLTIAASALLSGCMGFHYMDLESSSYAMSADKRAIISVKAKRDSFSNSNDPSRIVCPEPSPDVAKAVSRAIEAMIAAENKAANGVSQSAQGRFSSTSVESLVQLGQRTVTIQALRDEYTDLCRTYANGAINSTSYTIRLARLDRKMMSMHTSEMIAGNFGGKLASISGTATGAAGHSSVIKAGEDLDTALTNWKSACGASQPCKAGDAPSVDALVKAHEKEFKTVMAYVRGVTVGLASTATPAEPPARAPSTPPPTDALVAVQSAFLAKDDLPIIVDACVTALDYAKPQGPEAAAIEKELEANQNQQTQKTSDISEIRSKQNAPRQQAPSDLGLSKALETKMSELNELRRKASALIAELKYVHHLSQFGFWCTENLRPLLDKGIAADQKQIDARREALGFCMQRSASRQQGKPTTDPKYDAYCERIIGGGNP